MSDLADIAFHHVTTLACADQRVSLSGASIAARHPKHLHLAMLRFIECYLVVV